MRHRNWHGQLEIYLIPAIIINVRKKLLGTLQRVFQCCQSHDYPFSLSQISSDKIFHQFSASKSIHIELWMLMM